ncbi:hypothetical protein V8E53_003745 [Lactarius tabidus]
MDSPPSPGDPRDQILSLLSALVINGPATSVNPRPGTQTASNVVGAQVTEDPDEVVARATEKQLEQNALYMRMKMLVTGQSTEISELQESNTQMHEENGALKEQCVTLKEVVDGYTKEYLRLKSGHGNSSGGLLVVTLADLPPVPKPFPKIDCPKVTLWSNADFHNFIKTKNQKAGETDRNSSTSGSGGRCCKKQGHPYLQNKDSSLVTGDALGTLSSEVRVVWLSLNGRGMAPTMFSKMSSEALEFLWRSVLPVPELEFLLYCDDGHWKLKEWCKQNYSSWARNHGIRLPAKTESIDDVLNNTKLLHMDTPASHEGEVPLASTSCKSVIKNLFASAHPHASPTASLTSAPIEAQSTAKPNTSGLSTWNPTPMSAGTHTDGMNTNRASNTTTFTQATAQPSTIPNHATTGSLNTITQVSPMATPSDQGQLGQKEKKGSTKGCIHGIRRKTEVTPGYQNSTRTPTPSKPLPLTGVGVFSVQGYGLSGGSGGRGFRVGVQGNEHI